MKSLLFALLIMPAFLGAQQNEKLLERMREQIAVNKIYMETIHKGYKVIHGGLRTISKVENGDFHLHLDFIEYLQRVNPSVKNSIKVADIMVYQLRILKDVTKTIQDISDAHHFDDNELKYCRHVFDNLLDECSENINELITIITDACFQMKDDERIGRIEQLYSDMQDKYCFASSFSNEMGILSAQRFSAQVEINLSKKINGSR